MPGPLVIGAIAAGAAGAGLSYASSRRRRRRTGALIREGYGKARKNLGTRQMDIRQAVAEGLNARGILNGGAVQETPMARPEPASSPWAALQRGVQQLDPITGDRRKAEDYAAARKGAGGARNTYAGGVSDQLTGEFDKEYEDLNYRARAALEANDAQGMNEILGAIAGGVQTGLGVYSAFSSGAGSGSSGSAGFKGAFGIDVVDPLEGINFGFNVGVG